MHAQSPARGPWTHRVLIGFFSLLFALLVYWMLGFVVRDLGTWPGPSYRDVEARLQDPRLRAEMDGLQTDIEAAKRTINEQKQRQAVLRSSTENSERTMTQLLELQKLTLQKGLQPSPEETAALAESEKLFLNNQRQYQALNEQVASTTEQLQSLENRLREAQSRLQTQQQPISTEFQRLQSRHQLKVAALKLSFLLPLLIVAVALFLKRRSGLYSPLIYGFGLAVLAKVVLVMHEHFPRRYFKYVLIVAALILVARILVYLLRLAVFPRPDWLLRQYREAYEHFLCPICGYPIRRGPLKYLSWTRRSLRKLAIPTAAAPVVEEPYICPVCATPLFEECPSCHAIRHSLLPVCTRCGAERPPAPESNP